MYNEYLLELENAVHALQTDRPVLIMGDFNAHISNLHYGHGNCESNLHGYLLMNVMKHTLCELTSCPGPTSPTSVEVGEPLWSIVFSTIRLHILCLCGHE